MVELDACLQATQLCDFDRESFISEKAASLVQGAVDERERFDRLFWFVKELLYGLEDWDIRASETLSKGWGMCCGKTNLLVAMSRVLGIPSRYKVTRIKAESRILEWSIQQEGSLATQMGELPSEQDHVECEVYINGIWYAYDPARDTPLENGLKRLGISLERETIVDVNGVACSTCLSSIDTWARERQRNRQFKEGRKTMFARANKQLEKLRRLGGEE